MPQIFFPHDPKAMGVEVALISYFVGQPGNLPMIGVVGGANAPIAHAALAGVSYWLWNEVVAKMFGGM